MGGALSAWRCDCSSGGSGVGDVYHVQSLKRKKEYKGNNICVDTGYEVWVYMCGYTITLLPIKRMNLRNSQHVMFQLSPALQHDISDRL
jgi:hypothetical protein